MWNRGRESIMPRMSVVRALERQIASYRYILSYIQEQYKTHGDITVKDLTKNLTEAIEATSKTLKLQGYDEVEE
jgi:hypothetical protein